MRGNALIIQNATTHRNALQRTATHRNASQHLNIVDNAATATHCNILQHAATSQRARKCPSFTTLQLQQTATNCNLNINGNALIIHNATTATRCNTLQHAATHYETLQRTATPQHVRKCPHHSQRAPDKSERTSVRYQNSTRNNTGSRMALSTTKKKKKKVGVNAKFHTQSFRVRARLCQLQCWYIYIYISEYE